MNKMVLYAKARLTLELPFRGLPYGPLVLINTLINLANPDNGLIENITYHELSEILLINSAPGRKDSGAPEKNTIRNYLNTIQKHCGAHFKVVTENQKLRFIFPDMPAIFSDHLGNTTEVNTQNHIHVNTANFLVETTDYGDLKSDLIPDYHTEVNTDLNTPIKPVKNIFIYKNNNNKQTTTDTGLKLISQDFYPTETTISAALQEGLVNVQNENEIKAFINYNQAKASLWVDFNPVFLRWLRRGKIHEQEQQAKKEQQIVTQGLRRFSDATNKPRKETPYDAVQKALLLNQQIINDNKNICLETGLLFDEERHGQTLGGHDFPIRPTIFNQAW